jgi:hypothetical protein
MRASFAAQLDIPCEGPEKGRGVRVHGSQLPWSKGLRTPLLPILVT